MNKGKIEPKITKRSTYLIVLIFLLASSLLIQACSSTPDELSVGDEAPDFTLPSSEETMVSLSEFAGEQPVLLFFHMAEG